MWLALDMDPFMIYVIVAHIHYSQYVLEDHNKRINLGKFVFALMPKMISWDTILNQIASNEQDLVKFSCFIVIWGGV